MGVSQEGARGTNQGTSGRVAFNNSESINKGPHTILFDSTTKEPKLRLEDLRQTLVERQLKVEYKTVIIFLVKVVLFPEM